MNKKISLQDLVDSENENESTLGRNVNLQFLMDVAAGKVPLDKKKEAKRLKEVLRQNRIAEARLKHQSIIQARKEQRDRDVIARREQRVRDAIEHKKQKKLKAKYKAEYRAKQIEARKHKQIEARKHKQIEREIKNKERLEAGRIRSIFSQFRFDLLDIGDSFVILTDCTTKNFKMIRMAIYKYKKKFGSHIQVQYSVHLMGFTVTRFN